MSFQQLPSFERFVEHNLAFVSLICQRPDVICRRVEVLKGPSFGRPPVVTDVNELRWIIAQQRHLESI